MGAAHILGMTQKASTIREAAKAARSAERFRQEILLEQIRQAGRTERTRARGRVALQLRAMTVTAGVLGALLGGPVVSEYLASMEGPAQPAPVSTVPPAGTGVGCSTAGER
ncbi:hypothetical protein [Leifsonia shinshuensis]